MNTTATNYELIQGDAVEVLSKMGDGSVDMFLTDPPYESLEKHRAVGSTTRLKVSAKSSNPWFGIFPNDRFPQLLTEMYRVLKKDRHCYIFCDDETSDVLRQFVAMMPKGKRFTWWKRIVWDKEVIGMGYHYRNQHEFIVFLEKGKRRLNDLSIPSVLRHKRIHKGFPAEKPVGLCDVMIRNSTQPGEVVCDPFCGSSSTGRAAKLRGRKYIGIDTDEGALEVSHENMMEACEKRAEAEVRVEIQMREIDMEKVKKLKEILRRK
jgi:site-specific DNA-methyltransferase (adenine-specific)